MKKLYSLYEKETKILSSVPSAEIREYLGSPNLKMKDYTEDGKLFEKRYRIVDEGVVVSGKKDKKPQKPAISADMWKKWQEVCSRLNDIPGLDRIVLVPER